MLMEIWDVVRVSWENPRRKYGQVSNGHEVLGLTTRLTQNMTDTP